MKRRTYYETFAASRKRQRLLAQEGLILDATEALALALRQSGITKAELAERLGRAKSFVSQILGGGRNLTLRTMADVAEALGHSVVITLHPKYTEAPLVMKLECIKPVKNWSGDVVQEPPAEMGSNGIMAA